MVGALSDHRVNFFLGITSGGVVAFGFHPSHKLGVVYDKFLECITRLVGEVYVYVGVVGVHFAAASAEQCVKLLNENEEPIIRSAITYVIEGDITEEQFAAIQKHCINPVDSRAIGMEKLDTLVQKFDEPADVIIFDGFTAMAEDKLKELYDSLNLAMTFKDFLHIQNYFRNDEKRDPSMTEIRVLDTYWSDHCRHFALLRLCVPQVAVIIKPLPLCA